MRNIETEIQALKEQIAMLEKVQRDGCTSVEFTTQCSYTIYGSHVVVYSQDRTISAIILDEVVVRKYLANKGAV